MVCAPQPQRVASWWAAAYRSPPNGAVRAALVVISAGMASTSTPPQQPPSPQPAPAPRRPFGPGHLLALVIVLVIAGGVALLIDGPNSTSQPLPGNAHSVKSASFDGGEAAPPKPAPPLQLHNYQGRLVNLNSFRGKAVLVTFLYTNCPDVCPLITADLHTALELMGPAKAAKTQIIAVSVDPRGDTPKAVAAFLARHEMTGRMQYLIGSEHELGRVWKAWNVGSERDAQQPQLVNHTGLVYGISASGKVRTLYAASFKPSEIAHDVPLLASQ
jgi:protein SCO1/2